MNALQISPSHKLYIRRQIDLQLHFLIHQLSSFLPVQSNSIILPYHLFFYHLQKSNSKKADQES